MSLTDTKDIMIYAELSDGMPVNAVLEILAKARTLADARGEAVVALMAGAAREEAETALIQAGADKVIAVSTDGWHPEVYAEILKNTVESSKPALFLAAATQYGKDLTPAVAKAFGTACAVDVLDIQEKDGQFVFTCPVYGGTVLNDVVITQAPAVASVRSGSFSKAVDEARQGDIVWESAPAVDLKTIIKESVKEIAESVNLEEAEVIVAGGRGMGSKENFELVKELAEVCGGVVGATRPAIEDEWIPRSHQVGQSGKIVAPKLYIACGISGATQHVSGMIGSDYIVAINKDEDAPIFDVADVGIVDDAIKVIPLLIDAIKEIKA